MNTNNFNLMIFLTVLFFLNTFKVNAQENSFKSLGKIEIGGQGINISYETPLSKNLLLDISSGIGASYNVYNNSVEYVVNLSKPSLFLQGELVWIYNKEKRLSKGKSILNNSGNFVAFQSKYSFGYKNEPDQNNALLNELHWGLQRSLIQNLYFNTHFGIGYIYDNDNNEGNIYPAIGIRIGYVLVK